MAITPETSGVFAIAPTPFLPDGAMDLASIKRMTDFYIESGVDGLTVLGIMGEAPKLEPEESLTLVKTIIAHAPRLPVVVGVSAPGFAAMAKLAKASMDAGAAGVMIAPLPSLRTDDQIVTYYRQAVEVIGPDVPFVLQDHPLAVGVVMAPGMISRIIQENPSCAMLKHEDWPGLEKISVIRRAQREGKLRPISILCGNGGLFLDFEMERGADGAMTGYAFPDMLVELVSTFRKGDRDRGHDLFDAHLPLIRYEQQAGVGLAVRKYVLQRRGAIAHDTQRKPGSQLSEAARGEIDCLLKRLAKFDRRASFAL